MWEVRPNVLISEWNFPTESSNFFICSISRVFRPHLFEDFFPDVSDVLKFAHANLFLKKSSQHFKFIFSKFAWRDFFIGKYMESSRNF